MIICQLTLTTKLCAVTTWFDCFIFISTIMCQVTARQIVLTVCLLLNDGTEQKEVDKGKGANNIYAGKDWWLIYDFRSLPAWFVNDASHGWLRILHCVRYANERNQNMSQNGQVVSLSHIFTFHNSPSNIVPALSNILPIHRPPNL